MRDRDHGRVELLREAAQRRQRTPNVLIAVRVDLARKVRHERINHEIPHTLGEELIHLGLPDDGPQ